MAKVIDAVINLRTPQIVQAFPESSYEQCNAEFTGMPLAEIVSQIDEAGVEKGLLHASDSGHWGRRVPPKAVARAVEKYPQQLMAGAVGVDPYKGMQSVRQLEGYVKEYGFKALHFFPHWLERPPNHAMYYPFYAKCVELDIPVFIQISIPSQNFLKTQTRPEHIDEIAVFFPELRIVGLHMGVPWLEEYMALLVKQPNLYMTTSGHPTSEWEPKFTRFVNTVGQGKIIFGSAAPTVKGGIKKALAGIEGQNLDEATKNKVLRENAVEVFKL